MIEHHHLHAPPVALAQTGGHGVQPVLAPRGQHQVEALGGKHLRERLADAGGGAGDERRALTLMADYCRTRNGCGDNRGVRAAVIAIVDRWPPLPLPARSSAPSPRPAQAAFSIVEASIAGHARRDGPGPRHVAADRAAVARPHRALRAAAERRHHAQLRGRSPKPTRAIASGGRARPRAAARHPDRAQGQHPHHRHADDRRCAGVCRLVPPYEATLTTQLREAGAVIVAKTVLTELANWVAVGMPTNYSSLAGLRLQPLRPAARPAPGRFRRPAGARHRRLELRASARPRASGRPTSAPRRPARS